ncbi:MAG: hypothetical protein LBN95_05740 [Prevotellaceae bacterium]|jgi:hypothetical protein|nr:hypothetical protein [Prevotellaceae bacterium]
MDIIDKNIFFSITQTFDYVPFTQSEGWWAYNSVKDENRYAFFVDDAKQPSIACMGYKMQKFGLKMLEIAGECLIDRNNLSSKKIRDFYKEIAQIGYDMVEVNSSLPYNALYEIGIRQAGFLRPAGLFSTPLTILLDLRKPIEYDKNWQNNLRRTEKHQLTFAPATHLTNKDIEDYLFMHNEMVNRKQFNDGLSYDKLKILLCNSYFKLFFVEDEQHKRIAGMLIYERNNNAISILSTVSAEGKQKSAAYFRDREIYRFLKEQGVLFFDRGRISPAAHKKNNIFLFKNGVKGDYLLYCGEFSWYKRHIYRPLMYFVKKYLFKRVEL